MRVERVRAHRLKNVPIKPPPLREVPNTTSVVLVEVTTDDGLSGWAVAGFAHPVLADLINQHIADAIVGEDPLLISRIKNKVHAEFSERHVGVLLLRAWSAIDIALWDIKGQAFGQPVHRLLGGARDRVPVYITHGMSYDGGKAYTVDELVAEAKYLVENGHRHLKNVVGRQAVPNPDEDAARMAAVRDAVGPAVQLGMDASCRFSVAEAQRLCRLTEDLSISTLEEPVYENDPALLAELRAKISIPIAAAQNHKYSALMLLSARAVDVIQPNVNNDGGFTGASEIAALAKMFNVPIGHGNGSGPANVSFQAGIENGTVVEYHINRWSGYNAIFRDVPQPVDGFVRPPSAPGTGLVPNDGLIEEYATA